MNVSKVDYLLYHPPPSQMPGETKSIYTDHCSLKVQTEKQDRQNCKNLYMNERVTTFQLTMFGIWRKRSKKPVEH